MNKEEFEKLEKSLSEKGYKKYAQQWHHEDYIIGKSFHKWDNPWEEGRAAYQIIISVYDWTIKEKPFYNNLPEGMKKRVGLEVHIDMSRVIDERLDLTFDWKESDTIESVEKLAETYYEAMCKIVPEPRKD